MNLKDYIEDTPNFPQKGIVFKDISPLLADKKALQYAMEQMSIPFLEKIKMPPINAIVGIEARGFITAAILANILNTGLIMIRKPGKLPPPIIESTYQLEYGSDTLQIKKNLNVNNVIIVDDVLATGGTLQAANTICKKANYNVLGFGVLIDLTFLHKNQFQIDNKPIHSVIKY